MSELCVVHLVRRKNGRRPFIRFLESYRQNPPGIDHELILLYKGFGGPAGFRDLNDCEELARDIPHGQHRLSDRGLDIRAYFTTARTVDFSHFCFLNSHSRPLTPDWLRKMWTHAQSDDIGAVGATGSYQSFHSRHLDLMQPVREASLAAKLAHAWRVLREDADAATVRRRVLSIPFRLLGLHDPTRDFAAFPNPHLRTNGFLIARSLLLQLTGGTVWTKAAAFRFESGVHSMTNQLLQMGRRVLIVGRNGESYEPERWPESRTFRVGEQENLLIADNQTDAYAGLSEAGRKKLNAYAWGGGSVQ